MVYFPENENALFSYSDGEDFESKLLKIFSEATDKSLGSPELNLHISDWASKYHISAQRADLLRPLENLLKGEVLEIGCGCGAVTRYLGETGALVTALEGSSKRAEIAASRCSDLENVTVVCDNFLHFEAESKFDAVTLIGVLEYSRMFMGTANPVVEMLEKARSFLKPGGVLLLAIENQLGLKYFAGAPEDHLGIPFSGIENRYGAKGPITFGKKKMEELLCEAGYNSVEFLYPFPDYKLPAAIVTEKGTRDKTINLSDILKVKSDHSFNGTAKRSFDTELALKTIIQNELTGELANSFLIVAGQDKKSRISDNVLAYTFSTQRKRPHAKMNKFIKDRVGYVVKRLKCYPSVANQSARIKHNLVDEQYIRGELYLDGLFQIVQHPGWSVDDIVSWARPWCDYLKSKSTSAGEEEGLLVPGHHFDSTPFNLMKTHGGEGLETFDIEWILDMELRIDYVVFRGLYHSLSPLPRVAPSPMVTQKSLSSLCQDVVKGLFPRIYPDIDLYERTEKEITSDIFDQLPERFFDKQLSFHLSNSDVQEPVKPLENIAVQVFWGDHLLDFSEDRSFVNQVILNEKPLSIVFNIPPVATGINFIRFDIGCEIGMVRIHNIRIRSSRKRTIWTFDRSNIVQNANLLLIDRMAESGGGIIQLATSNDPQFTIKASGKVKMHAPEGLTVEIILSAVDVAEAEGLKKAFLAL